jgi:hypothetical protein
MSNLNYSGKIALKTFKESQQESLIKAKVMPASKLAETAKRNAKLLLEFEASCIDEERHRKTATTVPKDKLDTQPLTRERFEE